MEVPFGSYLILWRKRREAEAVLSVGREIFDRVTEDPHRRGTYEQQDGVPSPMSHGRGSAYGSLTVPESYIEVSD